MSHAEWSSKSRFNPFNTNKILRHLPYWASIKDGNIPAPMAVTVDPSMLCNYACPHCNVVKEAVDETTGMMTRKQMVELPSMLKNWGVKAVTLAGGGEPLMNPHVMAFIQSANEAKLDCAMITNGLLLNKLVSAMGPFDKDALACLRWIGVSFDAGCKKTYNTIKGISDARREYAYNRVLENIHELTSAGVEVGFKFLLNSFNQMDIIDATRLAKDAGCAYIHIRPMSPTQHAHLDMSSKEVEEALENMEVAREMYEDGKFRVYGVTHKFGSNFKVDNQFGNCWSSMMYLVIQPGMRLLTCCDCRGTDKAMLATGIKNADDIPSFWGTQAHKDMAMAIDVKTCGRCTFNFHNQAFENMVLTDRCDSNFI